LGIGDRAAHQPYGVLKAILPEPHDPDENHRIVKDAMELNSSRVFRNPDGK
jgi:hypothetical protein